MRKRPLCVLCCCFIFLIILLTVSNLPVPWNEQLPTELEQIVQEGTAGRLYGQLYHIQKNSTGYTLYIKNSILVVRSNQYSLQNTILTYSDRPNVCIGNSICATGKLSLFQRAVNEGQFDAVAYYKTRHILLQMKGASLTVTEDSVAWISQIAAILREQLGRQFDRVLTKEESGILKTMLLGDKSGLDQQLRQLYQKNGISHILAISGIHISLLGMGIYKMLRRWIGIKVSSGISCFFLLFYLVLTGFSVSAQRAVYMFWMQRGADCTGRTYDEPTALSLAALVVLCENPLYIYDSGFLLSFGAAFFIWLLKYLKVGKRQFSLLFWLCMLPVTACMYYEVSFIGVFLNCIVLPPLGIVLFLGLSGSLLGIAWCSLGDLLLWPAGAIVKLYTALCRVVNDVPWSTVVVGRPPLWQLVLYGIGMFMLLYLQTKRMKKKGIYSAILGGILVFLLLFRLPTPLSVTMLDVGQGDCLVIQKDKRAVLVDGGSTTVSKVGRYRIAPYLRYRGIQSISSMILTHPDTDHMNGLCELLEMKRAGELSLNIEGITVPRWMKNSDAWENLKNLADTLNIPIIYAQKGDSFKFGPCRIRILHPDNGAYTENANEGSLTFLMETEAMRMLFTGDLEGEGEDKVCKEKIEADVLKIAHHGSKYSTEEPFLKKSNPRIALISCGKENTYGHPHKETICRLQNAACSIYCTTDNGRIRITEKRNGYVIDTFCRIDKSLENRYRSLEGGGL